MNIYLLCLLWVAWCAVHSLLIDGSVIQFTRKRIAWLTPYYRILYNSWSLVTFVPLVLVTRTTEGLVIFSWNGYSILLRVFLLFVAVLLFKGGGKQYDLGYFLGIKQLRSGADTLLLSGDDQFTENGVFGITRHPWYFGSLLLLWTILSEYSLPVFVAICVMSLYLVIGTFLEERKIVAEYGDGYCRYRQKVSMLFPWKWLVGLFIQAFGSSVKK